MNTTTPVNATTTATDGLFVGSAPVAAPCPTCGRCPTCGAVPPAPQFVPPPQIVPQPMAPVIPPIMPWQSPWVVTYGPVVG